MPTEQELLQMALRWIEKAPARKPGDVYDKAALIDAINEKIKPRREWVSLSDHELELLEVKHAPPVHPDVKEDDWWEFARAIEAKLKEKNNAD